MSVTWTKDLREIAKAAEVPLFAIALDGRHLKGKRTLPRMEMIGFSDDRTAQVYLQAESNLGKIRRLAMTLRAFQLEVHEQLLEAGLK